MKKIVLTLLAALAATAAHAETTPLGQMPAGEYVVDKNHASVIWKVSHLGLSNYTARFKHFDATIQFDPKNPTESHITATIDPASVHTDFPHPEVKDFDKELATGEGWFNAGKFPTIRFVSTSIVKTSDQQGHVVGDVTFLGVTKPVTLDVTFNDAVRDQPLTHKPTLGFSAKTTLKRSDWGMTTYAPAIGDEVTVIIEAEFAQEKPAGAAAQ